MILSVGIIREEHTIKDFKFMKIANWEQTFKDDTTFLFGAKPNKTIVEFEHLFDKKWEILDVGCGDGKNAIYLAKQGFCNVDAFDMSHNAIDKVRRICETEKIQVNTEITTANDFEFTKQYDLMLSFGVFHFMDKNDWKAFIRKAQKHTNIGGIHIIQIFNDNIAPTPDIAPFAIGMAKDGEIKKLYEGWEIIQYLSYTFEEEHPNVPLHSHASNKIVARKIE